MPINQKEIEAVLKLPAPKRYDHFIKKVVGMQRMWGLFNDGWAMSETDDGLPVLPLWPEREYAELAVGGDWATYQPREIELEDALENMIPMLRDKNILPGVFFTADKGTINATLEEFERDLRAELDKYA